MATTPPCDVCHEEIGAYWVTNAETGAVTTMGFGCFALVGMTSFLQGEPGYVDGVLKEAGYTASAALKRRRAGEAEPELDPARTIATITETGPRPDDATANVTCDDCGQEMAESDLQGHDCYQIKDDKPPY